MSFKDFGEISSIFCRRSSASTLLFILVLSCLVCFVTSGGQRKFNRHYSMTNKAIKTNIMQHYKVRGWQEEVLERGRVSKRRVCYQVTLFYILSVMSNDCPFLLESLLSAVSWPKWIPTWTNIGYCTFRTKFPSALCTTVIKTEVANI